MGNITEVNCAQRIACPWSDEFSPVECPGLKARATTSQPLQGSACDHAFCSFVGAFPLGVVRPRGDHGGWIWQTGSQAHPGVQAVRPYNGTDRARKLSPRRVASFGLATVFRPSA